MSMRAHGMRVAVLAGLWLFVTTAVSAQSLKSVEIRGVGDGTRIVLDVDGEVSHKSFTLEKPDRVVVDLVGARNAVNGAPRSVPGGPVKQIRVAQFASDPKAVTRIVADLRQPSTFQVERVGGKLVLAVTPKNSKMPQVAKATSATPSSSSSAATSVRGEDTTPKPRVVASKSTQTQTSAAKEPTKTAPSPTKSDATSKTAVTPTAKTSSTANTASSVRRVPTASSTQATTSAKANTTQGETTAPSSVRNLQSSSSTATSSAKATPTESKTAAPKSSTAATSAAPAKSTAPATSQNAVPKTQTTKPKLEAQVSPTKKTQTEAKLPAGTLAPKARALPESKSTTTAKPKSTTAKATPKSTPRVAAQPKPSPSSGTHRWQSDALATREDLAPDPQPIMMQQRPGRRVNLDLQGADIRTVLRTLSDYAGVNIIASKEVQGEVSARIKDAPWRDALESILKAHGFGAVEENGIIRVGEIDKIRMEDLEEKAAERKRDDLLPIVTSVVRLEFAAAGELQHSLQEMNTGRGKIQVDQRTNSLIVSDISPKVDQIIQMAHELDGRTPQVEIVSKLVDVSADDAENLGIDWAITNIAAGDVVGAAGVSVPNVNPAGAVRVGTVQSWGQLDFMLDALAQQQRANIVSNPNITTVDNREAKILVGSKIPLIVADEAGNAITQLTTVGIQMRVTPHVNSDKTITLDMHPEVSELSQQATVQGGVIINTSEADTRVIVDDGETAVIGGLIRNVDSEIKTGIPILQDIPGLGWMFSNTNKNKDKRELIIFVTPRLIGADVSLGGDDAGEEDSQ